MIAVSTNGHLSPTLTQQLCQVYRTMIEESNEKQNAYLAVHIHKGVSGGVTLHALVFIHKLYIAIPYFIIALTSLSIELLLCTS